MVATARPKTMDTAQLTTTALASVALLADLANPLADLGWPYIGHFTDLDFRKTNSIGVIESQSEVLNKRSF